MSPSKGRDHWVGFDLGGTKMLAVVYDDKFKQVGRERKKTKGQEGAKAGVQRVISVVEGALSEAGLTASDLAGIGIGAPGPLDLKKGILLDAPNLGWKNVELKKALEHAFGCPVVLCNDVDAGVYGEYAKGAGKKARCLLGLFPGTGVGGGCVLDGNLVTGGDKSCLEIGHLPLLPEGPLCGCGQRGCLETVASRLAIASEAAKAAARGEAPFLSENTGTDLKDIRSGALAAAIEGGDGVVEVLVRDGAQWLGYGAAGVINLLAPDVVLLGGGMVEAMPDLYLEEVERALRHRVMPSFEKTFKVVVAELGDDAAVVGAAAWARKNIET